MGKNDIELSAEEKVSGDIAFVHKDVVHKKNGYAALLGGMENGDREPAHSGEAHLVEVSADPATKPGVYCGPASETLTTFTTEVDQMRASVWKATGTLVQWGAPLVLVLLSLYAQAVSARIVTVYYVRYMRGLEKLTEGQALDPLGRDWIFKYHHDYPQKLQDLFASWVPSVLEVPPFVWDLSIVPLALACLGLIIWRRDTYMWAKASACFVALNLGRSLCHIATVVPDSQGWESCKDRLTNFGARPNGVEEMTEVNFHWKTGTQSSLQTLLEVEATGMRYCGDMIYSGQTFMILLQALVLREVLQRSWPSRRCLQSLVAALAFPYAVASTLAALAARYHYTLDVVLSALLTPLWYDSSTLARACAWWASLVAAKIEERTLFVPVRQKAAAVSAVSLAMGTIAWVVELVAACAVAWCFHSVKQDAIAGTYLGAVALVGFVLVLISCRDADLRAMPACLRWLASLALGLSHAIFLLKIAICYRRGKVSEDMLIIKVFRAGLLSAPLICVGFYSLLTELDAGFVRLRYIQLIASIYVLGDAVAHGDAASSVLSDLVQNSLWRTLLTGFRMAEAAARITALVVLQYFADGVGYRYGVVVIVVAEFLLAACLVRCMGAVRKFFGVVVFAGVSLVSNVHLFQRSKECRRVADVLSTVRLAEFLVGGAVAMYYFKYVPGGMEALFGFVSNHQGVTVLLASSVAFYLVLSVVWLEIRRAHLPQEWDDQDEPEVTPRLGF